MSGNSNEQRLEEILATCMTELLGEMKLNPVRITDERPPLSFHESLTAFCGFGSTDFRGSVTLLGSVPLFSQLHPLPTTVTPRDLVDWACELVNQSVGRFRNRLLAYGVKLALSVPQSALAEELCLASSFDPTRSPISFAIDSMVLEGWLELDTTPTFQLAESPLHGERAALEEGSIVLF